MPTNAIFRRWPQIAAWAVASLFVLGFFFQPVGAWTGPILGVWFVGTQKPWRGFFWLTALTFLPSLVSNWRIFSLTGPEPALEYVAWMLLVAVLGVLPFLFHRLTSPRLPGVLSTLPLPLWGTAFHALGLVLLPRLILAGWPPVPSQQANALLLQIAGPLGALPFFILWFAAVVVWLWNAEFRANRIAMGASIFAAVCVVAASYGFYRHFSGAVLPQALPLGFAWVCLAGAIALGGWALFNPGKPTKAWADRPQSVALLQSPYTGNPLRVVRENNREALLSTSGEQFPIRDGIPVFLKPEDLSGENLKYNHLYETIGGFYDDTQRVWYALKGMRQDAHFLSYLHLLEIKSGDSVLETSVGTGLNFKYLPRGVKLSGLDLSPEMLTRCQANLRRWELDADLFVGNAETLPFADSSFDVVFHVGGINFFSDRAKAIREMIRVAKPGSLILIADETEVHAKSVYENFPITRRYFKNRKQPVTAPVDLVPPKMQEIRLLPLLNGHFYALTFRKPDSA